MLLQLGAIVGELAQPVVDLVQLAEQLARFAGRELVGLDVLDVDFLHLGAGGFDTDAAGVDAVRQQRQLDARFSRHVDVRGANHPRPIAIDGYL